MMGTASQYWMSRFGRHLAPDATSFEDALMHSYPHATKAMRTRLGGSEPARFLISAQGARAWAPIATPEGARGDILIEPTGSRTRRDWLVDVLLDPPPVPFLAASLGASGADAGFWRMTVDRDLIAIGGAAVVWDGEPLVRVDRARFLAARDWFADGGLLRDLLRLGHVMRDRRRRALSAEQLRAALRGLDTPVEVLRGYPGEPRAAVMRLAAHAAAREGA